MALPGVGVSLEMIRHCVGSLLLLNREPYSLKSRKISHRNVREAINVAQTQYVFCLQITTMKLGYIELGYNKFPVITNKKNKDSWFGPTYLWLLISWL